MIRAALLSLVGCVEKPPRTELACATYGCDVSTCEETLAVELDHGGCP